MRYFFFILISVILSAQTEHFIEERHIDAIDKNVTQTGEITFSENSVVINYHTKPGKKIVYSPSRLELFVDGKPEAIPREAREYLQILLRFFDMLNAKNTAVLREHFKTHYAYNERILTPKNALKSVIDTIHLFEKNNGVQRIVIYFKNRDILTITSLD